MYDCCEVFFSSKHERMGAMVRASDSKLSQEKEVSSTDLAFSNIVETSSEHNFLISIWPTLDTMKSQLVLSFMYSSITDLDFPFASNFPFLFLLGVSPNTLLSDGQSTTTYSINKIIFIANKDLKTLSLILI